MITPRRFEGLHLILNFEGLNDQTFKRLKEIECNPSNIRRIKHDLSNLHRLGLNAILQIFEDMKIAFNPKIRRCKRLHLVFRMFEGKN